MKKIAIVALLSAFAATPALADNTGKFYGALDAGRLFLNNTSQQTTNSNAFPNPGALRIVGGYHYSPMLAVELGYTLVGDAKIISALAELTSQSSARQVAAVGTYPVNTEFDLIGKLGLSMNSNKLTGTGTAAGLNTENSSTTLMYGIGAQYHTSQKFSIRVQYEDFDKSTVSDNLTNATWKVGSTMFSAGLVYNF